MRFLYTLCFYILLPFVFLRLYWRGRREPGYRQAPLQRLGFVNLEPAGEDAAPLLWVHAVSAGEMTAAAPLIQRLLKDGYRCLVTSMTPTGRARCQALLGDTAQNCYAPYDLPGSIRRFIRRAQPKALIIIDTELWPNTIRECARQEVPALLVNGRLSAQSAERYARLGRLSRPMMAALDLVAVQTDAQAERFLALGARRSKVKVTGSIKFDGQPAKGVAAKAAALRNRLGGRPAILGASTHPGEEAALLYAYGQIVKDYPDHRLIIAPRHTERAAEIAGLIFDEGYAPLVFSAGQDLGPDKGGVAKLLLVDVMGELDACYAQADIAFVGGSLVDVGGHNLLEAVRADAAVIMGPHLRNLDELAQQFQDAEAIAIVQDQQELAAALAALLADDPARKAMLVRAKKVLHRNQGALARTQALVVEALR